LIDPVLVGGELVALAPATFDERRRAIRNERMASHLSSATRVAAWVAGLAALLGIVGAGLLSAH
jgi:hypothetical protein